MIRFVPGLFKKNTSYIIQTDNFIETVLQLIPFNLQKYIA